MSSKVVIPTNVQVSNLVTLGNVTASNALVTNNVFATNVFATGNVVIFGTQTPGLTTLQVFGNVVISNALTVSNLYLSNATITNNVYVSNAVTTNNVFATNVFASSFLTLVTTGRTTNYTALGSDSYIGMSNGGTVTIPLGSSLVRGKTYTIKDESGLAGTNAAKYTITIQMSGADLLDGQSATVIQLNYAALTIMYTGAPNRWSII